MSSNSSNSSESEINMEKATGNDTVLELQLGDVITISNPLNEKLNNQTFFIDYIDKTKAYLINIDTLEKIKVKISEDGVLGDGNIDKIAILSRSETPSYARQNGLLPKKWLNIYFGGDTPTIIIGEITNLEEDMIEIKTISGYTFYINFDYKGLSEDLQIVNIEIREKPQEPSKSEEVVNEIIENEPETDNKNTEELIDSIFGSETSSTIPFIKKPKKIIKEIPEEEFPELEKHFETIATENLQINPIKNVRDQLREIIIRADQIQFGNEEIGRIVKAVDVKSEFKRYSIEIQVTEFLDELLSTIPNSQRTSRVLNNIHIIIERYKQLRETFSFFDKYGNIEGMKISESTIKPLSGYFNNFKRNLYWILPVVKNIKKVYDINDVEEDDLDIVNIKLKTDNERMEEVIQNYKSNRLLDQNNYSSLYNDLNNFFTPFDLIGNENMDGILIEKHVKTDINTIVDNLGDMYSSVSSKNVIDKRRFVSERYNAGLTKLDTIYLSSNKILTKRVNMTPPDILSISSFITLPEPAIKFSAINLPGSTLLNKANLNLHFLNYWQLLKEKTKINYINIDSLDENVLNNIINEENFANSIKSYFFNLDQNDINGLTREEIYKKFINMIIPKIKVLFNLMKKYMVGRLSIVDIISYLEPFLIYTDDITYMQYVEITKFIVDQISEFIKRYIERSKMFMSLRQVRSPRPLFNKAFPIIDDLYNDHQSRYREEIITDDYDLTKPQKTFTNSEILKKLVIKYYNHLYTTK
jgi:hypothetical protein